MVRLPVGRGDAPDELVVFNATLLFIWTGFFVAVRMETVLLVPGINPVLQLVAVSQAFDVAPVQLFMISAA